MITAPTPDTGAQFVAPLQSLIGGRILALREQRVMLDADLDELYGVQTRVLVQAFNRNIARFAQDFMHQLSINEFTALRSQTVTSNTGRGGLAATHPNDRSGLSATRAPLIVIACAAWQSIS